MPFHITGIYCNNPGVPGNGTRSYNDIFAGSIVTYNCKFGFRLVGNIQRTCQESGMWNGTVPMCQSECSVRVVLVCNCMHEIRKLYTII